METNVIFKVQMEEVQDKIAGITIAIASGVMYQTYKTRLQPELDVLVQKRDDLMAVERGKI